MREYERLEHFASDESLTFDETVARDIGEAIDRAGLPPVVVKVRAFSPLEDPLNPRATGRPEDPVPTLDDLLRLRATGTFAIAGGGTAHVRRGLLHREDGPALIWSGDDLRWFRNGRLHRADGPAIVRPDGVAEWWTDGDPDEGWDAYLARRRPASITPP